MLGIQVNPLIGKLFEKRPIRTTGSGLGDLRDEVEERFQREGTHRKTRMGNDQSRRVHHLVTEKQNIDVEPPRPLPHFPIAVASRPTFYLENHVEEFLGSTAPHSLHNGVSEVRLRFVVERRRFIER